MLNEVWIIYNYNLYESKKHFSLKLADALKRHGVKTRVIDFRKEGLLPNSKSKEYTKPPDLCCSFNRVVPNEDGTFFWEKRKIPYLSILVDPACYDANLVKPSYSLISCVDRFDCYYLQQKGGKNVFFFPHAIEKELFASPDQPRPYDVVFFGSSYDPQGLRKAWQGKYIPQLLVLFEEAARIALSQRDIPFWKVVDDILLQYKIPFTEQEKIRIYMNVDNYMRGVDRLELIRSIKDASVHVFGGTCWRDEHPISGWAQALFDCPNVTVHPAVPYWEILEICKQSKICLNSMPFFKNGTHERIFFSLACGALPITTDNLWVRENFINGKELLLYETLKWNEVNDKINYFLAHEAERQQLVRSGYEKVLLHHTWDQRAEQLLEEIPAFIQQMKQQAENNG